MWCCGCGGPKGFLDAVLGFSEGDIFRASSGEEKKDSGGNSASKAPEIFLDSSFLGHEVVVVKNGLRICGTGGALGSQPLLQTKSYFEVKLQQDGCWGIGLSTRNISLDEGPYGNDPESWILRESGDLYHNQMTIGKIEIPFQEGDVFGIAFDHIHLCFYVNGQKSSISFSNVRGTVYPALFVDQGAVLDVIFDGFNYPIPSGFERIIKEKTIL